MTYEIMTPQSVGINSNKIVLGKHSGRYALKERIKELNYQLDDNQIEQVYQKFTKLCDDQKVVREDELVNLIKQVVDQGTSNNRNGAAQTEQNSTAVSH